MPTRYCYGEQDNDRPSALSPPEVAAKRRCATELTAAGKQIINHLAAAPSIAKRAERVLPHRK